MGRYRKMFSRLGERGEGAFVPFVVIGDPDPDLSLDVMRALVEAGADALELGIPFSDPVADGPTIQDAGRRALAAGVTPPVCWEILSALRAEHPHIPIGLLVYANLVVTHTMEAFYARASEAGVDSVLVADVPAFEAGPFVECALGCGVEPVLIAPPDAGDAQLARVARLARGYTYVLARSGVTGADERVRLDHAHVLSRLEALGAPPALLGFGISRPGHVRAALDAGARGAISGSAVVKIVEEHLDVPPFLVKDVARFVREMKHATGGRGRESRKEVPQW
jgi:tryptophan synthase alpha chain